MRSISSIAACVAGLVLVTIHQNVNAVVLKEHLIARQQQQAGTPLFLDEPACDSYQCSVIYNPGDNATAHWTDAPTGNVILDLMTNESSVVAFKIATVPGVTTDCDKESQTSCGQFSWIVPSEWVGGNYTLRASSEDDSSVESYTDVILVEAKAGSTSSVAFSALDPTATSSGASSSATSSSASSASSTSARTTATSAPATSSGAKTSTSTAPTSSTSSSSSSSSSSSKSGASRSSPVQGLSLVLLACSSAVLVAFL
ncbi:hypothetical protein CBS101457_001857 [Exobasidium rhododendri]|nr:hypothetical protein CBS101457_001857 [Exobasidium rhododendri]